MKSFLTCEHAGCKIPHWLDGFLKIPQEVLLSHRGWDPGAYKIALFLQKKLHIPLWDVQMTRLLVEANRSYEHKEFFSNFSKPLPEELKARAVNYIYHPFRKSVRDWIEKVSLDETIIHLSIHSFTPILGKIKREAEIGLLYDPRSFLEKQLCHVLYRRLREKGWKVRKNYPYQGSSDGHTTELRKKRAAYGGVEIEINQGLLLKDFVPPYRLLHDLTLSIEETFDFVYRTYP